MERKSVRLDRLEYRTVYSGGFVDISEPLIILERDDAGYFKANSVEVVCSGDNLPRMAIEGIEKFTPATLRFPLTIEGVTSVVDCEVLPEGWSKDYLFNGDECFTLRYRVIGRPTFN